MVTDILVNVVTLGVPFSLHLRCAPLHHRFVAAGCDELVCVAAQPSRQFVLHSGDLCKLHVRRFACTRMRAMQRPLHSPNMSARSCCTALFQSTACPLTVILRCNESATRESWKPTSESRSTRGPMHGLTGRPAAAKAYSLT